MPSKTASKLLGEAKPPRPSDMFQQSNPNAGGGQHLKWRLHRTVGVAPTNIPEDDYEGWLQSFMENNDGDRNVNEIPLAEMPQLIQAESDPAIQQFLVEAEQQARHLGADMIAFTDVEGLA